MVRFACLLLLTALTSCGEAQSQDFSGRVVGITDGDTLTVLTAAREQLRVRLAEIDVPERGQPFSNRSRQFLSELAFQQEVNIRYQDTDQYGRVVGRIYVGDVDVSAEMIRSGAAWVYREYLRDRSLLVLEAEARANRRGLWGLSEFERVEPWDWRRGVRPNRTERESPAQRETTSEAFTCGSKQYCREMTSCEEALFYLNECGVDTIDGDKDGIPCEAICR